MDKDSNKLIIPGDNYKFRFLQNGNDWGLYLGIKIPYSELRHTKYIDQCFRYKSKNNDFEYLQHQVGGISCGQFYFCGKKLKHNDLCENLIGQLHRKYYETNLGVFGTSLDELNDYRNILRGIELDCNCSYEDLKEAIYPIDIDYLNKLTNEKMPEDLDDLLVFDGEFDKFCGCVGRWNLWILTENSD